MLIFWSLAISVYFIFVILFISPVKSLGFSISKAPPTTPSLDPWMWEWLSCSHLLWLLHKAPHPSSVLPLTQLHWNCLKKYFRYNFGCVLMIILTTVILTLYLCMLSLFSHVWFFAAPWTVTCTCQALQAVGFPRQEYWSRLPFPPPEIFPTQRSDQCLPHWLMGSLPLSRLGSWLGTKAQLDRTGCPVYNSVTHSAVRKSDTKVVNEIQSHTT